MKVKVNESLLIWATGASRLIPIIIMIVSFLDSRVEWNAASKQRGPTVIVLGFQWIGKFLAFGTLFAMADTARR